MFNRRVFSALAAVLAVGSLAVLPGCDWFQGSGSDGRRSPFLSNLGISASSVLCGDTFSVSFRYDDPQGDIARARVTLLRNGDMVPREESPTWPSTISRSSGTATFPFSFPCDSSKGGLWTIKVQVEDDQGHISNLLSGEIRLNAPG
jgi:hypothetical protein